MYSEKGVILLQFNLKLNNESLVACDHQDLSYMPSSVSLGILFLEYTLLRLGPYI